MPASTLFVAGPTASGKSAVAANLAEQIGGEIVNADAFQLYRGLDVLTAKPDRTDLDRVPHHLFSILGPDEASNAANFQKLARPVIREISERGRIPIVVGGSGLYMKTLTHGLSPLPPGNPDLRKELEELDHPQKVARLLALDPQAKEAIDLANPRYVTRALEICILTGNPASLLQAEWASRKVSFCGVYLQWDRSALYRRIEQRTVEMLRSGAIDEVRALESFPGSSLQTPPTAEKAIGIREIKGYLAGESTFDEMAMAIQQATRRYAKRQITWFKREEQFAKLDILPEDEINTITDRILNLFPHLAS